MNVQRSLHIAVLTLFAILLSAQAGPARIEVRDHYTDGDALDGNPVAWIPIWTGWEFSKCLERS